MPNVETVVESQVSNPHLVHLVEPGVPSAAPCPAAETRGLTQVTCLLCCYTLGYYNLFSYFPPVPFDFLAPF